MKFQSHLKNAVASALIAGMLVLPVQSIAKSNSQAVSGWTGIMGSAVSGLAGALCTEYFVMLAANVDPAQLALEYMIYNAMKEVTYKWKPEPQKSYESSAKSNEGNEGVDTSNLQDGEGGAYTFAIQALESVGIEVLGLQDVTSLANGRKQVVDELTYLTYDGDELVLNTDTTRADDVRIDQNQAANFQKMATAGVARAELGLETAYQASVDMGGDAANITDDTSNDEGIKMATAENEKPDLTLKDLPASVTSTGMAMRVQTLMNLELAQRINLSNALQGNLLSIEAAKALKYAPAIITR